MPKLDAAGRASYANFLMVNLPRAFAAGGQGAFGWQGGRGTLETARAKALESCAAKGAADCTVYAENLDVVWQGRAPQAVAAPGPFTSTWNYSIVPDNRYFWHGPAAAVGVYVWGHGFGMMNGAGALADARGLQPQPHVRVFNNVGFDVVRFDRDPNADARDRAAGWLEEALLNLRRRGYRRIVVGGQSRGGWNSLQMLAHAGLADAVVAISPAAHGSGGSTNLTAQYDDLRQLVDAVPQASTRLAFVQFKADPYAGDLSGRKALIERLRPRRPAVADPQPGCGACIFRRPGRVGASHVDASHVDASHVDERLLRTPAGRRLGTVPAPLAWLCCEVPQERRGTAVTLAVRQQPWPTLRFAVRWTYGISICKMFVR